MDQYDFVGEKTRMSSAPTAEEKSEEIKKQNVLPSSGEPGTLLLPAPKKHFLRWIIISAAFIVILIFLYFFRSVFVVATIDGYPISRLAVVRVLEQQFGAQAFDSLVNQTLVEQTAKKGNFAVGAEEIRSELAAIGANLEKQGTTLASALQKQGIQQAQLEDDIRLRKLVEKIVADKIAVSDEEVAAYIKENKKLLPPDESPDAVHDMVQNALRQQKFSAAFQEWLAKAKAEASILYWKKY